MTTEPKRLTRGRRYELETALNDAQRDLVRHTPRSLEWKRDLARMILAAQQLDADSAVPAYTTPIEHGRLNVKRLIAQSWMRWWKRQQEAQS